MSFTFITYEQLYEDILAMIPALPSDIACILGVPRSGIIAASMMATELHVPLGIVGCSGTFGGSRIGDSAGGIVLVLDDSLNKGTAMAGARVELGETDALFASIYAAPGSEGLADLVGRTLEHPRIFEWNLFNSWAVKGGMLDMDGVLCRDPIPFDDDGPEYEAAIADATPLHLPRVRVGAIVTNRIERWRPVTEAWLARYGVEYDALVMQQYDTAQERRLGSTSAGYKAEHYGSSKARVFIESHDRVAEKIAEISGKPVISLEGKRVYE